MAIPSTTRSPAGSDSWSKLKSSRCAGSSRREVRSRTSPIETKTSMPSSQGESESSISSIAIPPSTTRSESKRLVTPPTGPAKTRRSWNSSSRSRGGDGCATCRMWRIPGKSAARVVRSSGPRPKSAAIVRSASDRCKAARLSASAPPVRTSMRSTAESAKSSSRRRAMVGIGSSELTSRTRPSGSERQPDNEGSRPRIARAPHPRGPGRLGAGHGDSIRVKFWSARS